MDVDGHGKGQNAVPQELSSLKDMPEEVLEIIRVRNSAQFLDALSLAALKPALTLNLFIIFEPVFADSCSRWIFKQADQNPEIIEAFARILPLAPHLSTYLQKFLRTTSSNPNAPIIQYLKKDSTVPSKDSSGLELQRILLAIFRLLSFDRGTYSKAISATKLQLLFHNEDLAVRYLAIRIFCQLRSASDFKEEQMIEEHIGVEKAILGNYDGEVLDLGFLSLFEKKRLNSLHELRNAVCHIREPCFARPEAFSPLVRLYTRTLLPRPNGPPTRPSGLVPTDTTMKNMEAFAQSLLSSSPILLHGLAGSGKTSLVNDFARELSVDSNMITLHLNEQTDAKMLIGMYATGSTPGSFTWRAGVLTTAVREGRWVFIEDFDRAPNEVISVILPLIERGELIIPSRGETIKAGPGFKLLASIRTSLNVSGHENPPALNMLGARLWKRVPVQMPSQNEFREVIHATHPIIRQFIPGIINVYERLYTLSQKPSFASKSRTSLGRPLSPRDLLKWCRRLDSTLVAAGSKTGRESISEATAYEMFLEAIDCFASSLQTEEARRSVISCIAQEMHIDPQRVEHFLTSHIPRYEESERELSVGRVRLAKLGTNRVTKHAKKQRPFANTNHAKRLLEQVGVAVKMAEPVLLVGETGIGKTTVIQQLADSLGYKLTAVNLSQQSEVGDLLGGFKPVNIRSLAIPLKEEFEELFSSTGISTTKNQKYIDQLSKCIGKSQWSRASKLWREAPKMFERILSELTKRESADERSVDEQAPKRRKTESKLQSLLKLKPRWGKFSQDLDQFDIQLTGGSKGFAFTFVEGNIVKAARNGEWVLLDEINLASPDTLESIADLLHSGSGTAPSILLSETGEIERVRAHSNFRIFGAMNPATDVGKRDLPMGLRSRFTEIFVESPDGNLDDLLCVIKAYLKGSSSSDERAAHDVARLYMNTKRLAADRRLVDGANQVPHFSLRTLTRVLSYVTSIAPSYGLRRALYEGFAMGFLTLLDRESEKMLIPLINHHLLESHGNPQALLAQTPRHPDDGKQYVRFMNKKRDRQYWMLQGMETPEEQPHYIITPFVERNMLNLVRATSTRRFPVLVQGPTSSGKTSMIEYLAKFSGNKFVRINNHEHTDLQEYLGTYVSGSDGQLRFQEGLLVQALRQGHWIVLDELNLAPTDVLEALNRLLDDNRELLIPETQEIVRPHDNFMLFATQNPPGLYGGRKTLSRAFRNRFLELHFDDIPEDELDFILEHRSQKVAPSDCRRIVSVYKELSLLRQSNRLFEQKDSFATLRDLFRWALREADNREQLAANGFMLLAERVRNPEERQAVKEIIERVMKVKIDTNILYDANLSPEIKAYDSTSNTQGVVWTQAMRRLYVLVAHALRNNEPVLLVGETGCGKTTVCQMLADAFGKELHIVNAHQNTETGDLIGAQRPIRNRATVIEQLIQDLVALFSGLGQELSPQEFDALISAYRLLSEDDLARVPSQLKRRIEANQVRSKALFEWSDGSLVQAMKEAQFFLLDEISLADDSVLERLNSVLESNRTILLAEKGVENSFVQAADGFQFFATMNPGGDYGKRELSPALRNRFTEIWVPSLSELEDVLQIVESKLNSKLKQFASPMVHFAEWFGHTYLSSSSTSISVRDVLAWVKFMNGSPSADPYFSVLHGAAMVYIDTLGANPAALLAINPATIREERAKCLQRLGDLLHHDISAIYFNPVHLASDENQISIGSFSIAKQAGSHVDPGFAFGAPTTKLNAMRVSRALQVSKPILIEGSPGVGKTTLVAALARACGKPLTRINLSEQTDLMDLFGSDVPVEGAEAGHFAWRDAPFLQAMQRGEWVLLDEMNLASQSVLEGLNACLDHRGEVYISELDQTFKRHPNFSVFAAQNPHHQGGGRKGLPSSFVNRFTVVYADVFRNEDLELICQHNFPNATVNDLRTIINFVSQLEEEIVHKRRFGSQGGPWEFNLRDILRWLQLLHSTAPFLGAGNPADYLNLIFRLRFRSTKDRQELDRIFAQVFGMDVPFRHFFHNLSSKAYQVGMAYMPRDESIQRLPFPSVDPIHRLPEIEAVMMCIQQNMPCILVGPAGSGKTTIIEHVAAACGKSLVVFPLNADIDTMDLVGGFEQVDPQRAASAFIEELKEFLSSRLLRSLPTNVPEEAIILLEQLEHGDQGPTLFASLSHTLEVLESKTSLREFGKFASTCRTYSKTPMALTDARFEWVDGVLVKALEQGQWLVLDNANLCSASVLDRLNSLLEPSGVLSINEHCGTDGEPKIVKPHPDSRIFLTMDARFGEVSRAMRNRATEIFLAPLDPNISNDSIIHVKTESSMRRFDQASKALDASTSEQDKSQLLGQIALDNLTWSDMPLLPRFSEALHPQAQFSNSYKQYLQVYQSIDDLSYRTAIRDIWDKFAAKTELPASFRDAQIIHPLQNSPLVLLLQQSSTQVYWLAAIFELKLSAVAGGQVMSQQDHALKAIKPSKMNRLQRSLVSGRVSAVTNDSTVGVSNFLSNTMASFCIYLRDRVAIDDWKLHKRALIAALQLWWDTYHLVTSKNFDEATFQAHLAIGANTLSLFPGIDLVDNFQQSLQKELNPGFKLTTGLSMELLWKELRPIVISNFQTLEILSKMEKLATRFDTLRWNVSVSVSELGGIMHSLVKAYRLVLTTLVDGESLVEALGKEFAKLEASTGDEAERITPFFASQFEGLRQFQTIEAMRLCEHKQDLINLDIIILANHPTTTEMQLNKSSESSRPLQMIDYLWGRGEIVQPITGSFSTNLLDRLNDLQEVDLKSLRLLESELPILGEKLTSSSGTICREQLPDLNKCLFELIVKVFAIHEPTAEAEEIRSKMVDTAEFQYIELDDFGKLVEEHRHHTTSSSSEGGQSQIDAIANTHFNSAMICLTASNAQSQESAKYSALAWIYFAIGCLKLYVPDRAFDPDKRQRLERERHLTLRDTLRSKLAALQQFELLMTSQMSNIRCQVLEEELAELGEPAQLLQEIYRPTNSELDRLQGEFKNLLTTIVQAGLDNKVLCFLQNGDSHGLQEIKLIQNNVLQIIRRLAERFQGYSDLTSPVISMLRCLQIGLSMAAFITPLPTSPDPFSLQASIAISPASNTVLALSRMSPFLGAKNIEYLNHGKPIIANHFMEYLSAVSVLTAIEGIESLGNDRRQYVLEAIHECYERWSKQLDSDRLEAESKTGLYRFKGSADDEDEEDQEQFNELFPSYEDGLSESSKGISSGQIARDTAVQLAKVHSHIFDSGTVPFMGLLSLIRRVSKKIGSTRDTAIHLGEQNLTSALLPGALLLLNDQVEALSSNSTMSEAYNFYTDAHLLETRKLVSLVHKIQARFHELQAVDEIGHMQPLDDVLVSCRELLQFRHTEPLAKIITKLEKVHGFMHEWQFGGWASRANSVVALYDSITSTIVDWRRLELTTWAKLFEMESRSCDDDARSWWFVAYQVVIAAPLSISESSSADELKPYAQKLLKDLETYFSTSIVGQFMQRLQLLKQLQKHLEVLILESPPMAIISEALANFISVYERYKNPVEEHLKKSRVPLEKSMRDVILLATWKDTNIVALRDSAKRSHHNLFKIVRKFRALLSQPMEFILKQGLPDVAVPEALSNHEAPVHYPTVDLSALAICATTVPKWTEKSKRFVNVSQTVSLMVGASRIPESAVDGRAYLNSFLTNIISLTAELQNATPSVLTKDNKDTVKHLKSRKRKLFADTLKDLRNMGIKFNLGVDALLKQDSLSIVLASTKPLLSMKDFDMQSLQYYFQKSADIAPRAREAARQHSNDLSSAEIARSSGFLEGLLQIVLAQRNTLATASIHMTMLQQSVSFSAALWAPELYSIKNSKYVSNHRSLLRWMPNILRVGLELVKIHSKLGNLDNKSVEERIWAWVNIFQELSAEWDRLPKLPASIICTSQVQLFKLVEDATTKLHSEIQSLVEHRPDLRFILDQILLWTRLDAACTKGHTHMTVSELDQKLSIVCDCILLSIEKHQKVMSELPNSTEDPGWLVKNDAVMTNCIKTLHSEHITQQLEEAFEILRSLNLDDDKVCGAAAAIFAVAQPILQQYYNILHQAVIRYAELHQITCKTSYILAKTFTQIASQGFCTPSEQSDAQDGKTEKLEGGTGLGDGEGAEDISKDIQDDEDLDELAQEPNTGEKGDMEDEKDAVDMADGEMEGEMGEGEEKEDDEGGSGDDESGEDMDEEAGDVDDLDPNAVDEKMWDGDNEDAKKDQEGDESKGKQNKEEQVAAQESNKEAAEGEGDEEEIEEMTGAEQGEEVKQQDDVEKHDPHAQEGDVLDLPEDMELDGDGDEESADGSDDGMNDLSDIEEDGKEEEEVKNDGKEASDGEDVDQPEDQDMGSDMDVIDLDEKDEDTENKNEEAGEKAESDPEELQPEDQDTLLRDRSDEATADADNAVPSEVQGVGEDQDENSADDNKESASKAQREDGGEGGDSSEQKESAAENGEKGRQANGDAPQDSQDETQDSSAAQPFKKLGDALESWHRQQSKIREAPESKEQGQEQSMDMNAESAEFQHLQDDEAEADTQALGTATEEQAHALDESMAVDSETKELPEHFQPNEAEQENTAQEDVMDLEESPALQEQATSDAYEGRAGAMINQAKHDHDEEFDDSRAQAQEYLEEDVEEVDNQLESTHLDSSEALSLRSAADARQKWTHYEGITRDLSLSLTEQLRLILAPTLATKMRGDFRTGKRLNIKRIIPYIASQYKRDKIWMRRSVPSKRSYQVMLAVDDSKSMGESGSGSLAFETLVMVSKSLSMLEVGEICVVGFGENVKVAHDFDTPFSSDAGPKIFQNFGFDQSRTDVTKLVRESIQLFRAARQKASGSPADLWQMQLIISDGVCDSSEHEPIRRLLREALEERIMIVFVIVDDVKNKKKGESVMDLKEAKFVQNEATGISNVKIERYLDTFPFQYYLIVSDVKELPGVLATLLRQWFAEVVDTSS